MHVYGTANRQGEFRHPSTRDYPPQVRDRHTDPASWAPDSDAKPYFPSGFRFSSTMSTKCKLMVVAFPFVSVRSVY